MATNTAASFINHTGNIFVRKTYKDIMKVLNTKFNN